MFHSTPPASDASNSPDKPDESDDDTPCIQIGDVKLGLKIDKLTLLIDLHPGDEQYITNFLIELKHDAEAGADGIVPAGWSAKKGSPVALDIKVPVSSSPLIWSTDNGARLQLKVAKGGMRYLRLEIHPLGLTLPGFGHLLERVLQYHLALDIKQIRAARVSRIDIAMDIFGVRLREFAWSVSHRQINRPYVRKPILESLYLGSPKHGAPCLYDRGIQQHLGAQTAWTRIEMRPKPGIPLSEIPMMKNPFLEVSVWDVVAAMTSFGTAVPYRLASLAQAQLNGINDLLRSHPDTCGPGALKSPRQKLKAALEAATPAWFQPDAAWKLWPTALTTALPGIFNQ